MVYLDHAATSPMHPAAVEAMTAALGTVGNASSLHTTGRTARRRMEESRELIAANNTIEEIRQYIEADSLAYLSLDGLRNACDGGEGNRFCVACYTGEYPTQWVDVEDILPAEVAVS